MKKYFIIPIIVLLLIVCVLGTTSVIACTVPGSGSVAISSSRYIATSTTRGVLHDGEYNNRLTCKPSAVIFQTTNPGAGVQTVNGVAKDSSYVSSVSSKQTFSGSTAIKSAKNVWSAYCRTTGTSKSGTATAN